MKTNEKVLMAIQPDIDELLNHPFFQKLERGEYSIKEINIFVEQYYLFSCAFTRFLLLAAASIKNEKYRMPIIDNLYDEHGNGNYLKSHRILFQNFMKATKAKHIDELKPLPTTSAYIYGMFKLCETGSLLEIFGAIGPGCEYFTDTQYLKIVKPLAEIYKFTETDLNFFYEHIKHDEVHSSDLDNIIIEIAKTEDDVNEVIKGAKQAILFEILFWDGIYKNCEKSLKGQIAN